MSPTTAASTRRTLTRITAPLVLLRAGGQAGEFIGFVFLARRLGTSAFGEVSVAFLIARYGGLIADWGASLKGTRDVAAGRSALDAHALVRRRDLVTALLSCAYVAGAIATGHPGLAPIALTIVGRGLSRDWLALGNERAVRAGLPPMAQGLLVAAAGVVVTTTGTAAAGIGIAYTLAAGLSIALNPLPRAAGGDTASRGAADAWFLVLLLADQVYASADVILISVLLSTSEAGIYAAVYRFPNAIITVLGLVVVSLVPGLSRSVTSGAALRSLRRRALRVGAAASLIVVLSIPVAWALVPVVFGSPYEAGRSPLVILLLATAFPALTVGLQPLYFASGKDHLIALYASGVAVLNIGMNLLLIPHLGLDGAATVTLTSQALIGGFYLVSTGRVVRR